MNLTQANLPIWAVYSFITAGVLGLVVSFFIVGLYIGSFRNHG